MYSSFTFWWNCYSRINTVKVQLVECLFCQGVFYPSCTRAKNVTSSVAWKPESKLSNITCTEKEVYDLIWALPKKTAYGSNNISSNICWRAQLMLLFHQSILSSTCPLVWAPFLMTGRVQCDSNVQSGDPKLASNYHPTLLLSLLKRINCCVTCLVIHCFLIICLILDLEARPRRPWYLL